MGAQDRETYPSDVEMGDGPASGFTPVNPDAAPNPDTKAKQQDTGLRHREKAASGSLTQASDPRAVQQQAASDNSGSSTSESLIPSPSNLSTAATSLNADVPPTATSLPSIDEQIAKVTQLAQQELQDGQKGYVISAKWLRRVQARGSHVGEAAKIEKSATEGEVGPIDNSDVAMVMEESTRLLDEAGEPYVPLRPGLTLGEDYEIFPQEAWDLIVSWYGIAKDSPIITRYAHNWSEPGAIPNVTWELNPPVFSFLKVPSEHSPQTQRERELPPQRLLASKKKNFTEWLKEGKRLLNIDVNTKVRVWRVLGGLKSSTASGVLTPAVSRSASPAPGAEIIASAGDRMLLDVNTFVHLQIGEQRELLNVPDHTANPKYNGKSTLGTVGLGRDDVIVLEEQKSGKDEWPSENPKLSLAKGLKTAPKNLASSGRSSPAPGMMTRGRQKRDTRPRGITGLSNLGNTCYMNSALQCLRSVEELTQYFLHDQWKQDLNVDNALGHHGEVAKAYANLLHQIYDENTSSTNPSRFKAIIGKYGPSFSGYQQQDSQEFLLFLLDGLQEDLNRIHKKPYIEKPDSTDDMVQDLAALKAFADKNWDIYKARNDSVVTDLFAGMYKSTLTCPVCHKVSIIFDPFNNLTLQLPIENNWQKEILYFPLHKRPIRIDVDIDKHSSIKGLKEFVASRTHADVDRLLAAEAYKNKIYKIFDNNIIISEANIQPADIICVYELESIPTNYNPNKARKFSLYTIGRDAEDELVAADSPEADRLLVPMYNRLVKAPASRVGSKPFFAMPTYLVLTREDRATYDGILKKILGNVAGMTTRKIFDEGDNASEDGQPTPEGSDTVVMADDTSGSESNVPTAVSVQGEDGIIDVSMRDASQAPETMSQSSDAGLQHILQSASSIPRQLRSLFTIHVATTGEGIPTGWNQISESQDYEPIINRIPKAVSHRTKKGSAASEVANGDSGSVTSEDELADIEHDDATIGSNDSGSDSNSSPPLPSGPDSDTEFPEVQEILKPRQAMSKKAQRHKNRGKRYGKRNQRRTPPPLPPPQPLPKVENGELIRPGEAIVLDWTQDAWDGLFGASEQDPLGLRGAPTWKGVELFHDEEVLAKRAQRSSRKKNGITLEDCLNEFGKSETLSETNAWYCPRCKEHRRADKMFELWKAPDILVMHLKRFSSNRNFRDKLEVKVDYPVEGLDLSGMVRDQQDGKSLIYDLVAVDNHYGGLGGGHYTAYAKNFFNNSWYEYNDSHVSAKTDPRSVVTSAAYLLFYRRRSEHALGGPRLQELLESGSHGEADSDAAAGSRESSPVAGEGRRLGDSSHNGLSSAYTAGRGHRVGADGSAAEEESQDRDLLAVGDSPPTLLGPPADEDLPSYQDALDDEAVAMEDNVPMWHQAESWGFDGLPVGPRVPAPSEDGGMFGDKGSSNDSTRVEGNAGSPAHSLLDLDDADALNDPIYSEANTLEDYGGRILRESAPPPEIPDIVDDDEDDPPVMELQADPANDGELVFNPASK
ncbi:ubiquitin thiolesterase [Capronia coronata CBS 617.96]|uniref:ubiquitinyl hydrolase 1 n=1 Tax=Capronia coronata CBS 617.96 TaxID=1182541 RepID=W9YQM6_9EURO|nr:ubiquitin thiolesterase [Capronia coronata CBS 617.96]EXJ95222.1 ubiquitin thiolesterase [Capronia coronata CBS 617.96]